MSGHAIETVGDSVTVDLTRQARRYMQSVIRELQSEATDLSSELAETLGQSPLQAVAERLIAFLECVTCAVQHGRPASDLRNALNAVRGIRKMLPDTWGHRFQFDANLTGEILEEWQTAGVKVSGAVTLRYSGSWGLSRVPMPSEDAHHAHVIRVVTLPGADRLSDLELSDYPWLFHELAHDVLYGSGHRFRPSFDAVLTARIRALTLRAAADKAGAARYASEYRERLESYWRPRANQRDWAHEIATDIAALWALGPAFLLRFTRLLVSDSDNALSTADQHPPYVTRAEALVFGAERLAWSDEAWALQEEVRIIRARDDLDHGALVYADPELITGVVEAALDACAALSIPRMTPSRFAGLRDASTGDPASLSGTALIAYAALCHSALRPSDYQTWLRRAVGSDE